MKKILPIIIVPIFMIVVFLISIINQVYYINIDEAKLLNKEITVEEVIMRDDDVVIASTEEEFYYIGSIVDYDEAKVTNLKKFDVIKVSYRESKVKRYDYEIITLNINNDIILSKDIYRISYINNINQGALIIGIVSVTYIILMSIIFVVIFVVINKGLDKPIEKEIDYNSPKAIEKYEYFSKIISNDNNKYSADLNSEFENEENAKILCKYMYDNLEESQIRAVFDSSSDDEMIYLFYKVKEKLLFSTALRNQITNEYMIEEFMLLWYYPKYDSLTSSEEKKFLKLLEEYEKNINVKFVLEKEEIVD